MAKTASLKLDDKEYPLPIIEGTEGEKAIDTRQLRATTGHISYDQGYGNTGSCESQITFLDGDNGILRHRGYPIEQLARYSDFVETAYLIIYGELPNAEKRKEFGLRLRKNAAVKCRCRKSSRVFRRRRRRWRCCRPWSARCRRTIPSSRPTISRRTSRTSTSR